ncbi:MAG: beta-galactosidase [Planctomycetota bacterium]|nr:beta-galactosidase [Planctomycetota bacterium]
MPTVSYNEQCFLLDGRPFWVLGASMQYCRMDPSVWANHIAAAKQAGFNTIETACPWMIHEPRRGRFEFTGRAEIRRFVELCAEADMKVILRMGPAVGAGFDGSGIPGWLMVQPEVKLREADPDFLGQFSRYTRKLVGELEGMAAPDGGPIILVQAEHGWSCSNPDQLDKYHRELGRYIRESGFNIPILTANDLWPEPAGSIETWRGWDDLLVNLRQLRAIQPEAPRLVSTLAVGHEIAWGDSGKDEKTPGRFLERLCEVLAAGAQFIVSPFHAGTNFDFLGGRMSGRPDGFVTTSAANGAPLTEAGGRSEKYLVAKRLVTFANHFSHVFSELNPDFHPIVLDPGLIESDDSSTNRASSSNVAIVPQRGSNGRAVFVFGGGKVKNTTLLLDNGLKLKVYLGNQPVAWFVFDVDLRGMAKLDYVNLCPWAIVYRSILVLFGPEKTPALLSINESPIEATVPSGSKPLVIDHKGITLVILNQDQIDQTYHDDEHVYVGIEGFDTDGEPILPEGATKAWRIASEAKVDSIKSDTKGKSSGAVKSRAIKLSDWTASSTQLQYSGQSPRFASLSGPETLSECGASTGYGWYRITLKSDSSRKRLCHLPQSGDRLHLFNDGALDHVFGVGPGACNDPFELKLAKGENTLVILADNLGRFADGNDIGRSKGLFGHLYEVKAISGAKPKTVEASPVDPFVLRGFISGSAQGIISDMQQAEWSFTHLKKTSILIDVNGALCSGSFVLNDIPIAYYAGATGATFARIVVSQEMTEAFKRGKNVLRFAPDHGQENPLKDIKDHTTIYECVEGLSDGATWSFAKWEPPMPTSYEALEKADVKKLKGAPCWWKTRFDLPKSHDGSMPVWLDTIGLSKGQAYVNGHNLGRYFTACGQGKAVGPQTMLYLPESWLKHGSPNELLLFDEHGFDAEQTRIVFNPTGDF